MSWFVELETHTIDIETDAVVDGKKVKVKGWFKIPKELNLDESLQLSRLQGRSLSEAAVDIGALLIREWSFKDSSGEDVEISRGAIENLNPSVGNTILRKILDYYQSQREEKKATPKKGKRGRRSRSASSTDGAGSTSNKPPPA